MDKFIPRYFILFEAIMKGIILIVSLSDSSLLAHENATDLILYLPTLLNSLWYIYTMDYYSAIKNKKILSFVTARINLKNIMIIEINQSEKDKYHMISLICGT